MEAIRRALACAGIIAAPFLACSESPPSTRSAGSGVTRDAPEFHYGDFIVRSGELPPDQMLWLIESEIGGDHEPHARLLDEIRELRVFVERASQDSAARSEALTRWEDLRPRIDTATTKTRLHVYDDPANDADAQDRESGSRQDK